MCGEWLDKKLGDGTTERWLVKTKDALPMRMFSFTIVTSDIKGAGTDAQVYVELEGDNGTSSRVKLPSQRSFFERGKTDEIKVEIEDVGELKKMLVGHDGGGMLQGSSWHIDRITVIREGDNPDKAVSRTTQR